MPQSRGISGGLLQVPGKGAEATVMADPGSPRRMTFDLFNMVTSFKNLVIFFEPVNVAWDLIKYLLGWRSPISSLLCCVLLNVLLLTLSEVAWLLLSLLCVSAPATLGYLKYCSKREASDLAIQRYRHHGVSRQDFRTVPLTREEAMLEVKALLRQLEEMLSRACLSAECVHRLLYWESHVESLLFYGTLLTALCLLYAAPVCLSLAALNTAFFLWNREFFRVVLEFRDMVPWGRLKPVSGTPQKPQKNTASARNPSVTEYEGLSWRGLEGPVEVDPDDEFKDAIEDDDEDESAVALQLDPFSGAVPLEKSTDSRHKGSKLTTKFRKRYPSNSGGSCSHCHVAFSMLKKKKNCSNCGSIFCSRCCSSRVHRSCLCDTAPEAQRETVLVCIPCNVSLGKAE
ncbi:protrudin-like [Megalops cyprinoides]|uniref:protrudin-like n=1 Tax=Megalops cyprinoides TaxID=118141 RepID=UPI001864498E|nr:protrudin-like [Megalops cyprinoides]